MKENIHYEFIQIELFKNLKYALNLYALNLLKISYFKKINLPTGKVHYIYQKKKYKKKTKSDSYYTYVNAYIYCNKQRYLVNKNTNKFKNINSSNSNIILDDNTKPEILNILKRRLEILEEATILTKTSKNLAKIYYNELNWYLNKSININKFDFLIKAACDELKTSDIYNQIIDNLETYIDKELLLNIYKKKANIRGKFYNEIYSDSADRLRSKNELIAINCLKKCGLNYNIEPTYPNNNTKADLSILKAYPDCNDRNSAFHITKEIYIEIAGLRMNEKYEKELVNKQNYAREYSVPLVIIDMTDYPDDENRLQTKIDETELEHIFLKIYLGIIPADGTIIYPYGKGKNPN